MTIIMQKRICPGLSQLLKHRIELSQGAANEQTEEDKRVERPNEREMADFYCRRNNFCVS